MSKEKKFWHITFVKYESGYDGDSYVHQSIYWGTWCEAARECIKEHCYRNNPNRYWRRKRSITEFKLPDTKHKRKGFYVFNKGIEYA